MLLSGGGTPGKNIGKFLYEILPDIIPYNYLSDVECQLWLRHYSEMQKETKRG